MLHIKFGLDWPSSFLEENVNVQQMLTDADGRQPGAIGHLEVQCFMVKQLIM